MVVSDTHLGVNDNSDIWLDIIENFFKYIVIYCKSNNISEILHLGDFFHHRKNLNVKTFNVASKIFSHLKFHNINITITLGNHDLYYKNSLLTNSLIPFAQSYDNVTIVSEPTSYLNNDRWIVSPWNTIPDGDNTGKILFSHLEINGFAINSSGTEFKGSKMNIKDFSAFDAVYSGHFHTKSSNANIVYIGAPYPMTFNDEGNESGFYVFDEQEQLNFIKYENTPKFISLSTDNLDFDKSIIESNVIRFTFNKDLGSIKNQKVIDHLQSFNPLKLQINYQIKEDDADLQLDENEAFDISDNSQVIREYIDNKTFPEHIDKDTLKGYIKELEEM